MDTTVSKALINFCIELRSTIQFDQDFTATLILHPATYLNKVLVASSQGTMQLWNTLSQFSGFSTYCNVFLTIFFPGLVFTSSPP